MNEAIRRPRPSCEPNDATGLVTAEAGHVILDGLPGLAVTLTPDVAIHMAEQLIEAAEEAKRQRR